MSKSLSIEQAYQWLQQFAAREWRLLFPVALAFMALPPLMMDLLVPQAKWAALNTAMQANNPELAASAMQFVFPILLVVLVIGAFGGLTITAMALLPTISVREALTLALRRIGVFIGSLLLIGLAGAFLAVIVGIVFGFLHLASPIAQSLLVVILLGLGGFAGLRLITLSPMIVTRRVGPFAALRESWMLTRGTFWQVLAAVAIYMVGAFVVMLALSAGLGAVFVLAARAAGVPDLGIALLAVFQRGIGAIIGVGFHLLIAAIFRQLNDGSIRGI